jgi:hypothetical protein
MRLSFRRRENAICGFRTRMDVGFDIVAIVVRQGNVGRYGLLLRKKNNGDVVEEEEKSVGSEENETWFIYSSRLPRESKITWRLELYQLRRCYLGQTR